MANSAQARKRTRQNKVRAASNTSQKSALRTAVKKFVALVVSGVEGTQTLYQKTAKTLDIAACRGVIHKNKAARLKSRMNRKQKERINLAS